jgi:hypothetical protein
MEKPRTNREALELVITTLKTQTALAEGLGVVKQLVSRWDEIPPKYLQQTSDLTNLPVEFVLPELEAAVTALLGKPSSLLLPELIRLLIPDQKASSWPNRKKTKQPKPRKKPKKRRRT